MGHHPIAEQYLEPKLVSITTLSTCSVALAVIFQILFNSVIKLQSVVLAGDGQKSERQEVCRCSCRKVPHIGVHRNRGVFMGTKWWTARYACTSYVQYISHLPHLTMDPNFLFVKAI